MSEVIKHEKQIVFINKPKKDEKNVDDTVLDTCNTSATSGNKSELSIIYQSELPTTMSE